MEATFELRAPPGKVLDEKGKEVDKPKAEYVLISGHGQDGKDVTARIATDADRSRFKKAYAAFQAENPAPAEAKGAPKPKAARKPKPAKTKK